MIAVVVFVGCIAGSAALAARIRRWDQRDAERDHWHTRPPS